MASFGPEMLYTAGSITESTEIAAARRKPIGFE